MKAALRLAITFVLVLSGCGDVFSARLPRKDECLSQLVGSNERIVEPAGQLLTGYRVVPCDSDEAEFRVVKNALGSQGTPRPDACAPGNLMVHIRSEGELHMIVWPICLVPAT